MPNSTPSPPRCFALVPAAGVGERAAQGRPKQYVELVGRTVVAHSADALMQVPALAAVLVVLAPQDGAFEAAAPMFVGPRAWVARCGGATRADTVAAGLQALRERGARDEDWVLVHDAARCLLRPEWVQNLIEACVDDAVGGLLAMPVADTLKHGPGQRAQRTVDRRDAWAAQTPQMFRLGLLERALREAKTQGVVVTDEASAIEALGLRPLLVPCSMENLKVTLPQDFALAERLLRSRA
ncbi:2-C-methyl-D-erythritol 4-phosphate cytidylyltransferase [Inhella sp. 4Y17]|uniref:2-C-methyl-D-erythritol 4-phosphate cytidylyltransferase n=1 Tax=Inhella gelatinilytica TaxID=2795030 RepID=A0A931IY53_9BURK|nr:2-C-methyl-D-erythritol 4-phosphate cytidylyltransferase [Inhella gelatinilytica]